MTEAEITKIFLEFFEEENIPYDYKIEKNVLDFNSADMTEEQLVKLSQLVEKCEMKEI